MVNKLFCIQSIGEGVDDIWLYRPLENTLKKDQNITLFWTFYRVLEKKISKFDKKKAILGIFHILGSKNGVPKKLFFQNIFFSKPSIGP